MKCALLPFIFLGACAHIDRATLIEKRFEPTRSGVIKYPDSTLSEKIDSNKHDVAVLMRKFCLGYDYKVMVEHSASEVTGYTQVGPTKAVDRFGGTVVEFTCLKTRKSDEQVTLDEK